jgi:hypothetical protein
MVRRMPFLLPEWGFGSIDHGSSREQNFSRRIGPVRTGASGRVGAGGMIGTIHRGDPPIRNPVGGTLKHDLTGLMRDWPFEGNRLQARIVPLTEDRAVLQVRVELGILQMEMDGRPDGDEDRLASVESRVAEDPGFEIDETLAGELRSEAVQVHQRYVAFSTLEAYELVVRDTSRNLRVFDLCRDRASREEDRIVLEQFRPQVIATRARAASLVAIRDQASSEARNILDAAIIDIRRGLPEGAKAPPEIAMLEGMRDVLQPQLPSSQRNDLEQRLLAAIQSENYELAAILRDELRQM